MQDINQYITKVKNSKPNQQKFVTRKRGFVDYKFSELADYLGFDGAVDYAETVRRWFDFANYKNCMLEKTYQAFLDFDFDFDATK